ncbi:DUF4913 domain-containing protein [Streptomyces sp. NBC_01431]|uniref:DUF4913 domain-containing protein n=1 Tax=Streptomyces sp. NBC_01431 TaxID=2903863 RepID=UPI002E34BED7|nr:DUF4913 domain-containing protein [Streptomyces sp. NBC_01431]
MDDEWADVPEPQDGSAQDASPESSAAPKGKRGGKRKKAKKPPPLVYSNLDAFVSDYLAQIIRRRIPSSSQSWCDEWWRHPEALSRLAAVWRAWEHLQHDPALGMSTWWLHHADPHLRALMHPETGPFAMCKPSKHVRLDPLPLKPANPLMWLDPAFSGAPDGASTG